MGCAAIMVVFFPRFFFRNNVNGGMEEYIELLGFALILLGQIIRVSARGYKAEHSRESHALIQAGLTDCAQSHVSGIFLIGLGGISSIQMVGSDNFYYSFCHSYIMLIYKEEKTLNLIS